MITFSSKFSNVTALTAEYLYEGRNQAVLILYVDYAVKSTETGIILTFEARNPLISTTDFYKIVEKDATTDIVANSEVKIQAAGKCIIPIPVPYQTDDCKITVTYDGVAGITSDVKIDVDRDSIRYT